MTAAPGALERGHCGSTTALLRESLLTAALFAVVYNLEFKLAGPVTSGRLAMLLLVPLYLRPLTVAWTRFARIHAIAVVGYGFALAYAAVLALTSGDPDQASRLVHFLAYCVLGAVLWSVIENGDLRRFITRFSVVAGVQGVLIIVSLLSPGFRAWVAGLLVQGGHIELTFSIRPPGFSNSGGAALSVVQAVGVFASLWAAQVASTRRQRRWLQFAAVACLASTIVSGRTGLLLGLAFFAVHMVVGRWHARVALVRYLAAGILILALSWPFVVATLTARIPELDQLARWALELFVSGQETSSLVDLRSMPVPPLTNETMAGTGLVSGVYGNASGSDSGYIQAYFALGLPMALVFYATFFGHTITLAWRSTEGARLGALIVGLALIEMKEPFVFKYAYAFFVLTTALLAARRGGGAAFSRGTVTGGEVSRGQASM